MADMNDPVERRRTAWMIFDYLSQGPVLLPLAAPPPVGGAIVEVPATEEALANIIISVDSKNGTTALPMYLEAKSLQASIPGCRFIFQPAKSVLEMFVSSRYDFLIFDLKGQWLSWNRAKAEEVLEAGRLGPG